MLFQNSLTASARRLSVYRTELEESGVFEVPPAEGLLTKEEWEKLEALTSEEVLPYYEVKIGDAGEPNYVRVGRFVVDQDFPTQVNPAVSGEALDILMNPRLVGFLSELLGEGALHMRRAQVNLMETGAFVGEHLDTDSNPDYQVAVILQLGDAFTGGGFAVSSKKGLHVIQPTHRSMLVSNCRVPHAVQEVTSGQRKSLVFFVSGYAGKNRRAPESVPLNCDTRHAIQKDLENSKVSHESQ